MNKSSLLCVVNSFWQVAEQDRHLTQTNMKIDTEVASLKTMLESHKLDTIKYLAGRTEHKNCVCMAVVSDITGPWCFRLNRYECVQFQFNPLNVFPVESNLKHQPECKKATGWSPLTFVPFFPLPQVQCSPVSLSSWASIVSGCEPDLHFHQFPTGERLKF